MEHKIHDLLDHFSISVLKTIKDSKGNTNRLILLTGLHLTMAIFLFILCLLGISLTSKLLLVPMYSWLPSMFQITGK